MATSVENPAEHDTASLADNSHPQQKRGSDDDLGVGAGEKRWPGWPGESVFRILVPAPKVGGIIGRKGEFIKKICEESRARIKILDGPPAIKERAVQFANLQPLQSVIKVTPKQKDQKNCIARSLNESTVC